MKSHQSESLIVELRLMDEEGRRRRLYRMTEQLTIFGTPDLVIEWGSIGERLRCRVERFTSVDGLTQRKAALLARRRRRGYVLLGAA